MPTDGADFGKMKACYGKLYSALRAGAGDMEIADLAVRCVEREIRFDRGAPAFGPAVQLAVLVSDQPTGSKSQQLLRNADHLNKVYGNSPLTRHIVSATEKVVLTAERDGISLSTHEAARLITAQIARSRCEGMSAYATRHRTHSIRATESLLGSVSGKILFAPSLDGLAARMLNANAKGLPARPPRASRIDHSAEGLNNTSLESGL